jgi:hypothetical protein
MSELPIACTLTPDGMTARRALMDALAADGLLGRTATDTGLRLRLKDTAEIERRTRELVAAESRCCAFLDFELRRQGGELVLDISGPEDAQPVMSMFFGPVNAFAGQALSSSSATSASTRRAMSSRVARTSLTGRPFGSGRSQSM